MKLVLSSAIDQVCVSETMTGKIENALIKEFNKGKFEEIQEVDESVSDCNTFSSIRVS